MNNRKLLKIGIIGSIVTALCCFTPVLVILMSAVGLSAMLPVLDIFLLPLLAIFIGVVVFAFYRKSQL